ncbi:MAG TPA: phage holin family protein [Vicinamibacteria bacterium]|nr:phage holin family protein [Vicinamibacteria bacterium]
MGILFSILGNALGLLATTVVPGIAFQGSWLQLVLAGALFGLFNMIVRPLAIFLALPALLLTLGLFYFVLNGILLWLAQFVLPGYRVDGILAGILGSLVLMLVNGLLSAVFGARKKERPPEAY